MRQLIRMLGVAAVLTAGLVVEAGAESTLAFTVATVPGRQANDPAARIYAGPRPVMTLAGHGWKSITEAQTVANRLNALAQEGLGPGEIATRSARRAHTIVARGRTVVTIDKAVAASQKTSTAGLARVWAENLRDVFGAPYLSAAPVLVPVGESRSTTVKGTISGELTVLAATPVVTATWDNAQRTIRVFGVEAGRTELVLEDKRNSLRVPVRAARYAARPVGSVEAGVTGSPAPASLVSRAVRAAVGAGMRVEPGAWADVMPGAKETTSLWPGTVARVPTVVSVAGPEYLPYHAKPLVTVRNQPLSGGPADVLMVSNSPERLRGHGLWFEGELTGAQRARLLYHHVNGAAGPSDLVVEIWNLSDTPARVHVIAGTGGPSRDEAYVGHRAAVEFLSNRAGGVGWIVPVPARTAAPVVAQRMPRDMVASGVLELRPLESANLSVRLYLAPTLSDRMPRPIDAYAAPPLARQWHYPNPQRAVTARYEVGSQWAFVTIGSEPAAGLVEGDRLAGSYGVVYEIALELANPTALAARVGIVLEPAGGPARGALIVDGRRVETAVLRGDAEGMVARYLLAPGEVRQVAIQTMPQGGSNYPVRLVARPL